MFQASILRMYPAVMVIVAFNCLFSTIQASLLSLIAQRYATSWKIETRIGLAAILHSVRKWLDVIMKLGYFNAYSRECHILITLLHI